MKKLPTIAVLLATLAAAGWLLGRGPQDRAKLAGSEVSGQALSRQVPGQALSSEGDAVEARVAALERAVAEGRAARQLLEDEVFYLSGELQRLRREQVPALADSASSATPAADIATMSRRDRRGGDTTAERIERLVAAGFGPAQANVIVQREQELQMASLQARFDAERNGEYLDRITSAAMAGDALRAELGDVDYERFLEATGRSTSVAVSSVIESSPAHAAGLRPGDEIIRYDGERIFGMTNLTQQTMTGEPGQSVTVDILREGVPMQVVLPRGPLGITGGRRGY